MEGEHRLDLIPIKPGQHHVTLVPKTATDLPFFYLTKRKELLRQPIKFESIDQAGRPMRWWVTPNNNPAIGAPGIEAEEIWDRLVVPSINLQRDTAGELPDIIPLGKVRESLRTVGWSEGGWEARRLLKALRQIGSAWCVADFWMPTTETDEVGHPTYQHLKGEFSRMAIYAIGSKHITEEQLRDGNFTFDFDLDDTVYVQLHPLEVAIHKHQPPRVIDNQYKYSVSPAARRWYDLVGPKIFGAIKHKREFCDIRYSWYIRHHHTLKRHFERRRVVVQMDRLVEDHLRLRYVDRVEYRAIKEPGKEVDYLIRYYHGPAATESIARMRKQRTQRARSSIEIPTFVDQPSTRIAEAYLEEPARRRQTWLEADHPLTSELIARGVHSAQVKKLLSVIAENQPVIDQLEWADHQVAEGQIANPAGFYVYVLRNNIPIPADFETERQRRARQEAQRLNDAANQRDLQLRERYQRYVEEETDRYITETLPEGEYERLIAEKRQELLQTDGNRLVPERLLALMAAGVVRSRLKAGIAFTTFEAFCAEQEQPSAGTGKSAAPDQTSTESTTADSAFVV